MKIIDRKRIGPLLLLLSFAVIGSLTMMLAFSSFGGETPAASAQEQLCAPTDLAADLSGLPTCASLTATAAAGGGNGGNGNGGDDVVCAPSDLAADLSGLPSCASLTATAQANAAATAQAIADMTATAHAQQTAVAANKTATAVADAAATASAIAAMTATAQANADATATAIADMTATAAAKRTATAAARKTRTAIAQRTVTAGGAPPPAPRATATPVNIQMADVTAVEGATTVQPDGSADLMAGNVTVKLPTLSRDRTYQAMLSEGSDCGDMAMACAMITFYTAEGEMESDVRLISAAEIEVSLSPEAISELGAGLNGPAVAQQAEALGGIQLKLMDAQSGEWNNIPSNFMVTSEGGANVTAMTRGFSAISLMVYADVVEKARMQLSMALGTPTATPIPTATPVPPTPVPPTATPEPVVIVIPDTGDTPAAPFLLLLIVAAAASMLALVGTKVIMSRARR